MGAGALGRAGNALGAPGVYLKYLDRHSKCGGRIILGVLDRVTSSNGSALVIFCMLGSRQVCKHIFGLYP